MTDSGQYDVGPAWSPAGAGRPHRDRGLGWYAWRALILIVIPAGLLTIAVAGSLATYRAVQAAEGHGTKGYFVDASGARGEFRLPNGQVTRRQVTFADPPAWLKPGAVVPALDTGDVTYVFARHGSRHWVTNASVVALVIVAFGAWLWVVPLRLRHKRRAAAAAPGLVVPALASSGKQTVRSAAADPVWSTSAIGLLNGDISTRRINTALRAAADKSAYPLLVTVAIQLTDADRAMSPVSGMSDRLATITETVTSLITGHGVLAASVAESAGWLFLIYTGSTEWLPEFESQVRSAVPDHLVGLGGRRDPRWRAYRDLWRLRARTPGLREKIVLLAVVPLCLAVPAARYGLGWAAASFVSIEAWALIVAFASRKWLIPAQLAHPGITGLALTGVLWTALFPVGAMVVHPASPWACAAGAAIVAIVIVAALWPAQRRYYARMRAQDALRQPAGPTP